MRNAVNEQVRMETSITIEINGSRSVGVDFRDDAIQISIVQFVVQGGQNLLQRARRYVTVALAIVKSKGFLQFLLHGLGILLLQEVSSDVAESIKVDFACA